MRVLALTLALACICAAGLSTQPQAATHPSRTHALPWTRDYLAEVRANFTPENRAYAASRSALGFVEPFYTIIVALIMLFSGLSAKLRDIAHDLGRGRYVRVLVYFTLYTAVGFVLMLPFLWCRDYALEHHYDLSNQSLGGWMGDQVKALMLEVVLLGLIPILALAYRVIERSPRWWWFRLGLWALPVITAGVLIQPLVIEPAFNRFTPLEDEHLRGRILALAARAGIPASRVDQADKSLQTNTYNAYVSGFGASQHIVIWDTTLRGMDEDEILFVTGHEIGHYKLGHIWKGIVFAWGIAFIALFVTWLTARPLVRRFGSWWGAEALHDVAAMPLFAALLSLFSFLADPAVNAFSRGIEHEADVYALEITRLNDAGARAFLKLGSQNRSDPEPSAFVRLVQYDHPTLAERVRFALEYRPWEDGRPNRFFHERGTPGRP